jgi:isopentenyl-diphosphate delta-isomerase
VASPYAHYRLPYKALPEIDLAGIDTAYQFFGRKLFFPFLVSSMTGGPAKALVINRNLALACEEQRVALALGSMRVILKDPSMAKSFQVRKYCPTIPLFANLGLVQLNYGCGADEINRLLDIIDADGIFLHINHLQEAIQPEGDTNFESLLPKLAGILPKIRKPVLIKEVGAGIDPGTAKALREIGIEWIDVCGLGGTSWTSVEAHRRDDDLGFLFEEAGIPADRALLDCKQIEGLKLIAGGGIRSGLDIAKGITLGAELASSAKPLLGPALTSSEACGELIRRWQKELQISMFACGAKNIGALRKIKLLTADK